MNVAHLAAAAILALAWFAPAASELIVDTAYVTDALMAKPTTPSSSTSAP